MNAAQKTIKPLTDTSLEKSLVIIRAAFGKVTAGFGITEENTPVFAAYTTLENLKDMRARGVRFFGLFLNGSQVGVVGVEKEADGVCHMSRLAVLPEYWHCGFGRELVDYVIGYTRGLGVSRLRLGMVNENTVLKKWYLDMGFKEIEIKKFDHLPFTICRLALEIK